MSAASIETTPITEPLDAFLRQVIQTIHTAVNQGIRAAQDDPATADKAIADCEEIISIIMAGKVDEWIG